MKGEALCKRRTEKGGEGGKTTKACQKSQHRNLSHGMQLSLSLSALPFSFFLLVLYFLKQRLSSSPLLSVSLSGCQVFGGRQDRPSTAPM